MAENLKTIHFADGSAIPQPEGTSAWMNLGDSDMAYCWYDNSTTNRDIYGGLYTWAAAMNGAGSSNSNPSGVQGVCPDGWHLPSDAEWQELEMHLGMSQGEADSVGWRGTDQGAKLKETGTSHWDSPNTGANNSSGFTALPGGFRYGVESGYLGYRASFCSATEFDGPFAWYRYLFINNAAVHRSFNYKKDPRSVRCVGD